MPRRTPNLAVIYYYARRHDQAIEQCRKTLDLNPDYFFASLYQGWAHTQRRDYQEAIVELMNTRSLPGGLAPATAALGYVFAISGQQPLAQKLLRELEGLSAREHIDPYYVAITHLGLNQLDEAFRWLDRAFGALWPPRVGLLEPLVRPRRAPRNGAPSTRSLSSVRQYPCHA